MDFSLYWFMFPVSIAVATTAMLSGIGGAALFMPIFLLVLPLLGADYIIGSAVAAITVALLTQTFGFASGFVSYYQKQLIDFQQAKPFLLLSVPAAVTGSLLSHLIDPVAIRACYGLLMLILAGSLLRGLKHRKLKVQESVGSRRLIDVTGVEYHYQPYKVKKTMTGVGGFLSGLLSTGIGEVVMPQLVKQGGLPLPVAAATSVLVVIVTVMSASVTHLVTLISAGGINAVPWNLVCYTIPGVIIGGQIGPRLQGKVEAAIMQATIGFLFGIIGIAMLATVAIHIINSGG